jgi:nicotinamidase-related amidase
MKGAAGAVVTTDLKPQKSDYVIAKRTYSAFDSTGLDKALAGLSQKGRKLGHNNWSSY